MTTTDDARIIDLGKIGDRRGNLSIIEGESVIPFRIKRTYWVYDVPGGERRGGHAFRRNAEFIVALSGSFDVKISDGGKTAVFPLNRSYYGLYVPAGLWKVMDNFSTNSLALILGSEDFSEEDYILDYDEFLKWRTR